MGCQVSVHKWNIITKKSSYEEHIGCESNLDDTDQSNSQPLRNFSSFVSIPDFDDDQNSEQKDHDDNSEINSPMGTNSPGSSDSSAISIPGLFDENFGEQSPSNDIKSETNSALSLCSRASQYSSVVSIPDFDDSIFAEPFVVQDATSNSESPSDSMEQNDSDYWSNSLNESSEWSNQSDSQSSATEAQKRTRQETKKVDFAKKAINDMIAQIQTQRQVQIENIRQKIQSIKEALPNSIHQIQEGIISQGVENQRKIYELLSQLKNANFNLSNVRHILDPLHLGPSGKLQGMNLTVGKITNPKPVADEIRKLLSVKQKLHIDLRTHFHFFDANEGMYVYKLTDEKAYLRAEMASDFDCSSAWISLSPKQIFICGGTEEAGRKAALALVTEIEFHYCAEMTFSRENHAMAKLNDTIYVFGGNESITAESFALSQLQISMSEQVWVKQANLPEVISDGAATVLNDLIFIKDMNKSFAYYFNPETQEYKKLNYYLGTGALLYAQKSSILCLTEEWWTEFDEYRVIIQQPLEGTEEIHEDYVKDLPIRRNDTVYFMTQWQVMKFDLKNPTRVKHVVNLQDDDESGDGNNSNSSYDW